MGHRIIYASQTGAKLDSNVKDGGGTNDTEILQSVLDEAMDQGGLHLIMDGAALINGLRIHSNTTIECINQDCGFYLEDHSDCPLVCNSQLDFHTIRTRNIQIIGGTYNHNCLNQKHHHDGNPGSFFNSPPEEQWHECKWWVIAMMFFGVENLVVRDVVLSNQRTFAALIANWRNVQMENIEIAYVNGGYMLDQNQDGLHFWGPGQCLTMHNIRGASGDDFIALAPDENDKESPITDVLIDGVTLLEADQGIRLLSRENGRLDRVMIKNVTGTYKSFGFFINPCYENVTKPRNIGNYGNITFENISLRGLEPNYHYTPPFLFRIGGKFDSLTFRNILHFDPIDTRPIIETGYTSGVKNNETGHTHIKSLLVDGLKILDSQGASRNTEYITLQGRIDHAKLCNVEVMNQCEDKKGGVLLSIGASADIGVCSLNSVYAHGIEHVVKTHNSDIKIFNISHLLCDEMSDTALSFKGSKPETVLIDALHES